MSNRVVTEETLDWERVPEAGRLFFRWNAPYVAYRDKQTGQAMYLRRLANGDVENGELSEEDEV